ncbi:HNH endonuclease [Sinorhizobium meliloti]|uniref:HNH endonuclease n=1 Tax=Rhizobium meliloti TaxID=382 RepID=UPI000FD5CE9B|nr:HNH endonuclease [Sinorhizobium meliloti]RVJ89374.1 hypothetical protein CN173_25360 [Sinorhizobium meliloti]
MKTLSLPLRDTTVDLDTCIARASAQAKPRLVAHRGEILALFDNYTGNGAWDFERVEDLEHFPKDVRADLRKTYSLTYPNRALHTLRSDLLSVANNLCPYCRLEEPSTLDHFLPKSRHEPFASFAPNLVPMCKTCNTLKGTKGSKNARQFFTHAYFNQLANEDRFVIAQVAVGARHIATNFIIDFSADLDANILQRLAYQFSILRLGPRYQLAAIDLIYTQAVKLAEMERDGCNAEVRRTSLEGDALVEKRIFGASYWKAALLEALATNEPFYTDGYHRAL